jgi:RNA polymerase sigma-B factor
MSPTVAEPGLSARSLRRAIATASEAELLRMSREGDLDAREQLVRRFLPMARRLAGRYRHSGLPDDDLEQVASVGLIKAIDRYEKGAGAFTGYAVPTIVGEIKRHFRDKAWGMRVPRSLQERFLEVNRAIEELWGQLGRSPTVADIAGHTGLGLDEVAEALDASRAYSPVSLDAPHAGDDDDGRTLGDRLGDEDPHYGCVDLGVALAPAFRALPRREQQILQLRFVEDLTQSQIAARIGISQMHVSRLLRRALDKLSARAREPTRARARARDGSGSLRYPRV